jgi:hypothetical protein
MVFRGRAQKSLHWIASFSPKFGEGGGLLNLQGLHQYFTNYAKSQGFRPEPLERDSVLTCHDSTFADTTTAQFAAQRRQGT